jgi:hypothetical protein
LEDDQRTNDEEAIEELNQRIDDLLYENRQLRIQLRDHGLEPNV